MIESGNGGTTTLGTLVPSHSDRVKGMQISKDLVLGSLATEHDNSGSCEYSGVSVSGWGRGSTDLRFEPS